MRKKDIKDALEAAEKRLDELLPGINKRHKNGVENATEEPDVLRSGKPDDLEIPRAIKEQKNEKLPK